MRILIVGYGMVGHRCASVLSELAAQRAAGDEPVSITVLSKEARPAYDRVHLTALFNGSTDADLTYDDPPGVEVVLGEEAVALDLAARIVTGAGGSTYAYDALVLATGSRPFVPPVPGHDLPGCFVYRTVEDVDAIKAYAAGRRVGAVVGGGLLGLEAAGALTSLGLDTHVIEFAPRLMPLQVDDAGGMALRQRISELGVTVHSGTRTEAVHAGEDGAAAEMLLAAGHDPSDQRTLPVEMVVFAAGVRPWDTIGREFGLALGERGGIKVDAHCLTSDPHVYAVGECAMAMDGRVYGLVAPGYSMAETAARHILAGDSKPFLGADLSTKLKLMGVDVASFGDAFGTTAGARTTLYSDESQGLYKKLVVTEDGRLLGGILVGDASAYDVLKPLAGTDTPLPADPIRLLLPPSDGEAVTLGVGSLPDSATICSCHNVSKGSLLEAVQEDGCATVGDLKRCTKAGTGCGSCIPMLGKLLDAAGVEQSTALCPHFAQTRSELYEIVLVRRIGTFAQLVAEHGVEGADVEGCEICKPAVASILASLSGRLGGPKHILSGEQAALQDTNDHFLANLQKNGSYSVVPRIPGGEITPEKLIVIGEVARDFGLYTKITGGQRIDLFGARVEQLPAIWRRLVDAGFESGHAYGKSLRTVKSCVGSEWCRYGVQESVAMAIELELRYRGLRSPHKIKAAVSGCARECAEAQGKDIGVIATENGWNLYVAGNGGFSPRHADLFAKDLSRQELIRAIDRFLMFYIRTAERLERTSVWIERIEGGLEHVRDVVLNDSLGLGAELEALMDAHVGSYTDEWRAAIEDPETLRRFVSFVNAPDTPDPSIEFTTERGQIKPLLTIGRRADRTDDVKDLVSAG
ncbi:nitrite reductase large subunit NirB [Actinospica sp. MGRD01-02]|uniref:assimilatory sulfite reductase (ferredoxin) n=1 Tax=Actinospica acidithermotolerans TaxID=2828514 RepID=A0A941E5F9_9ACTN|nr:nitrite reductase large subunit NirB [Actinospica acidithermotolerans]MBR7825471.1 nitrite reductase large subunit NirB [Actinospica acidithermotolerans]